MTEIKKHKMRVSTENAHLFVDPSGTAVWMECARCGQYRLYLYPTATIKRSYTTFFGDNPDNWCRGGRDDE